jgi:hypothetical protein
MPDVIRLVPTREDTAHPSAATNQGVVPPPAADVEAHMALTFTARSKQAILSPLEPAGSVPIATEACGL